LPAKEQRKADAKVEAGSTLGAFAVEFLAKGQGKAKSDSYTERVPRLVGLLGADQPLAAITYSTMCKFKAARFAAGLSTGTVRRDLSVLRTVFSKAIAWGRITVNPCVEPGGGKDSFLPPVGEPKHRYLSREEWDRLAASAPAWLLPVLVVSVTCGLRLGEVVTLQWSDVDLESANLHTATRTKTGVRVVKLPAEAVEVFRALCRFGGERTGHVFRQPDTGRPNAGKPWAYRSARIRLCKSVSKAMKAAGIEGATHHTLRHTCASWMVANGAPLQVVKEQLGHASYEMTLRYAHLDKTARDKAATAIGKALA